VYIVLGGDDTSRAFFERHGLRTASADTTLDPENHLLIVWNPSQVTLDEKRRTDDLKRFTSSGGRIVVLATRRWDWRELCDIEIERTGGSRVFPCEGQSGHAVFRGLNLDSLKRWNGLPGTVAMANLRRPALQHATEILWVREPGLTTLMQVPVGDGQLLFSQLAVRERVLSPSDRYDPAADQLLLNLLSP
jgi:hypothetical protein